MNEILVDDQDKHLLEKKWYVNKRGYVCRDEGGRKNRKRLLLHRVIMKAEKGQFVDHMSGNKLDNRRSNLRVVTKALNNHNQIGLQKLNKSGYRGVCWDKRKSKWLAQATIRPNHYFIGYFDDVHEAGVAAKQWRLANMPGALD